MTKVTDAQKSALLWLKNRNGDGVFAEKSNKSVLIAAGDRAPIMRSTWNKLADCGLVEFYMNNLRLRVTEDGQETNLSGVRESDNGRGNVTEIPDDYDEPDESGYSRADEEWFFDGEGKA